MSKNNKNYNIVNHNQTVRKITNKRYADHPHTLPNLPTRTRPSWIGLHAPIGPTKCPVPLVSDTDFDKSLGTNIKS